ncbi:MAG: His/Gly/Thr/Pro-type tRNA ligase C-terminal domain-containing protein, partial [Patescibacteria group bacterium]
NAGFRVEVDDRQESMQSKIRQATLQKVPFLGIIGDKEISADNLKTNVNLRSRDGKNLGVYNFDKLLNFLKIEIDHKN